MIKTLALMLFLLTNIVIAQTDLPDKGSISEIKGKSKIYFNADAIRIKYLSKELEKNHNLAVVEKTTDAEFFIQYTLLETEYVTSLHLPIETGQLDVYYFKNGKKTVVWSKGTAKGGRGPADTLLRQFLKDFTK